VATPSSPASTASVLSKILTFLAEIGIAAELVELPEGTFLPGIDIRDGVLLIDEARLAYPGDVLHEAGHLAIIPAEKRKTTNHDAGADGGAEMAAIAWSYAAALHLQIDLAVVFHEHGYRGGARAIIDNFAQGRYVGVPVLEWLGMTVGAKTARQSGLPAYPHMSKWALD
jgi:hypothetical protein